MRTLEYRSSGFREELAEFCRSAEVDPRMQAVVAEVLADVRDAGDAAVARYTEKFDGVRLEPSRFRV
ncbi:MAG: histidinol dehydrogenase, partial [Verrucomicrobia bacterium]